MSRLGSSLFTLNEHSRRFLDQEPVESAVSTPTRERPINHDDILDADNCLISYYLCWFFSYFSEMFHISVIFLTAKDPLNSNVSFYFAIVPTISFCVNWITFSLILYLELVKEGATNGWRRSQSFADISGFSFTLQEPSVRFEKSSTASEKIGRLVYFTLNFTVVFLHATIGLSILVYCAGFIDKPFDSSLADDLKWSSLIAVGIGYFLPVPFIMIQIRIFSKRHIVIREH
ncbi:hypothetical protein M3Y98_00200100 [Aphelenchoides besseyi]|nr:hypothetical protein M3Y98_00200100 [Aphelenchoides besseyi]KAI6200290.1 hypothetical protein M3Y96_00717900 [Aphelenchoides besseyi]